MVFLILRQNSWMHLNHLFSLESYQQSLLIHDHHSFPPIPLNNQVIPDLPVCLSHFQIVDIYHAVIEHDKVLTIRDFVKVSLVVLCLHLLDRLQLSE